MTEHLADYKATTRAVWASGNYDAMMRQERLYELGAEVVASAGIGPGDDVLDVACGTGNGAISAARAGANVTGLDITPEMLTVAERRAADAGVEVRWQVGDAEALPFDDQTFDVVLSTFGCQFAPRHSLVAGEIARVLRPSGRMAICTWTPEGSIGDFFRTVNAYRPPLPVFAEPPLLWGDERHIREVFEGTGVVLSLESKSWTIEYDSIDAAVEGYTTTLGPTVVARNLAESQGRWSAMKDDLTRLFARLNRTGGTRLSFPAEYLLILGRKADQAGT